MSSAKCCLGLNVFKVTFCISEQYGPLASGLGIQGSTVDHKTYLPRTSGDLSYYLLICGWLIRGLPGMWLQYVSLPHVYTETGTESDQWCQFHWDTPDIHRPCVPLHVGCWCPDTEWTPGHQQPLYIPNIYIALQPLNNLHAYSKNVNPLFSLQVLFVIRALCYVLAQLLFLWYASVNSVSVILYDHIMQHISTITYVFQIGRYTKNS